MRYSGANHWRPNYENDECNCRDTKRSAADEITDLIAQSRADGVDGLDVYSIVHTREDQLLVVNEWESIDAFMDYVNGPHNMIELIEHLCERFDEENVCKAYSGMIMHQENSA